MKKVIAVIVVTLSLLLVSCGANLKAHQNSEYYPLIEKIDEYSTEQAKIERRNSIFGIFAYIFGGFVGKGENVDMDATGGMMGSAMENGGYLEVTDNQVNGVIESDLMKMTDKYIFRLGGNVMRVYSVEKENSTEVGRFEIARFEDDAYGGYWYSMEMYLRPEMCR